MLCLRPMDSSALPELFFYRLQTFFEAGSCTCLTARGIRQESRTTCADPATRHQVTKARPPLHWLENWKPRLQQLLRVLLQPVPHAQAPDAPGAVARGSYRLRAVR